MMQPSNDLNKEHPVVEGVDSLDNAAIADGSSRRDFMQKYGKLALVTPLALSLSMQSRAAGSEPGAEGGPF